MTDSIYQELILEEANTPQNFGELSNANASASAGNISCGDQVSVAIKLSKDKKTVEDIKWNGQGCVITRAAMSVTSEMVKGMKVKEVLSLDQNNILSKLGLKTISPGRLSCLMLGLQVICNSLK